MIRGEDYADEAEFSVTSPAADDDCYTGSKVVRQVGAESRIA